MPTNKQKDENVAFVRKGTLVRKLWKSYGLVYLFQEAYNKLERVSSSVHVVEFGPPKKENKPDFYEAKNQS